VVRIHRPVQCQEIALLTTAGKEFGCGIMADIAAIAAKLAELDIVVGAIHHAA
jgi:hypothetical protein